MIDTSSEAFAAINATSRAFRTKIEVDGEPISATIDSIKIYRGACGKTPSAGSIFVPYVEIEAKELSTDLERKSISVFIGVVVATEPTERVEWIPAGNYVVSNVEASNNLVLIDAIGTLGTVGSERASISLDVPQTVEEIVASITAVTGIPIRTVGFDVSTQVWESLSGSWRSALSIVAKTIGGFVTEDVNGNWVIASFCSGEAVSITPSRSQTPPQYGKEKVTLSGYTCETGTVDMSMGNPLIDPWDVLAVTDLQGVTHVVPCLQITHSLDGGLSTTVVAEAETEVQAESAIKGPLEQMAQDAYAMAESVEQRADSGEFTSTLLRVDSSRGTAFKNADVNTVLSAVIFYGSDRVNTLEQLHEIFGAGAYLQWQWQGYNSETWHVIPSSDSRLGSGGFTLTLSPSDVDIKAVFSCSLIA